MFKFIVGTYKSGFDIQQVHIGEEGIIEIYEYEENISSYSIFRKGIIRHV